MNADLPCTLSMTELEVAYRAGTLEPLGLVAQVLARIEEAGRPEVWISLVPHADLRARAQVLTECLRAEGDAVFRRFPLFGMPFSVKDNIDVAGLPTTVACPDFARTPSESAPIVRRLEEAGAILIGKTNLDQFATGLTGTRSPYGAVSNPFKPAHVSGGSSSGSAVSVALGQVAFSLGTDTAGSGRVPAGFCNLVGLKPTPGLVSTRGVFPAVRSLDCPSVFALTVAEGWRVMCLIAGFDRDNPYSRKVAALGPALRKLRIGVPTTLDFVRDSLAEAAFRSTLDAIGSFAPVDVCRVDFSCFRKTADLLYQGPWLAERRASIGPFHRDRSEALDPAVRQVLAGHPNMSAEEAFDGLHVLGGLRRQCESVFANVDVMLVPTAPTHPTLGAVERDPLARNSELGLYTNFVNLLGLCAIAIPGHFRADGLPAGITLIAPGGGDHRLAELARMLEPLTHQRLGMSTVAPRFTTEPLPPLPSTERMVRLAVVGAHLDGEPLNWQLRERGAVLVRRTRTAPLYRLFALPNTTPPKPGMARYLYGGSAIVVEVWELPVRRYGEFVAEIPSPLGIGTLELEDGEAVQGFLCEDWALTGAEDISNFGGWQAYLRARREESAVAG